MWYRFCKDVELEENNVPIKSWEDLEQEAYFRSKKEMNQLLAQERYERLVEKDRAFLYQIWKKYNNNPEVGINVLVRILKRFEYYKPFGPDMKKYYEGHESFYYETVCTDIGTKEAYELIDILRSLTPIDLEKEAKKPQIDSEYVMPHENPFNDKVAQFLDFKNLIYLNILNMPLPEIPQKYNNIRELDAAKIDELEYKVISLYNKQLCESLQESYAEIYNYYNILFDHAFKMGKIRPLNKAYEELKTGISWEKKEYYRRYFNLTTISGLKEFNKVIAEEFSNKFVEIAEKFL